MPEVTDNRDQHRFELVEDGETAFAVYERRDGIVVFVHTEVPTDLEGHGVGARLIAGALDIVRRAGERVVAQCSFVRAYIRRHPETQALLAEPLGD